MLKKFIVSLLVILSVLLFGYLFIAKDEKIKKKPVKKTEIKIDFSKKYPYRKYSHVKNFYKETTSLAVEIGLKYNVPPAALLAIAGVESGYGRGYVARITGNILSLGAGKSDAQLPSLYLPNLKKDRSKILYAPREIEKFSKDELEWKKRPASLKKDYRPDHVAGSTNSLDYFDNNKEELIKAYARCMEDFARDWISINKQYEPFVEARLILDDAVHESGKEVLFDKELNIKFIRSISGRINSFNYRTTWAPKVITIMQKSGLIELTEEIFKENKTFKEAW